MLDFSAEEIHEVLNTARKLKAEGPGSGSLPLQNKTLAMIFL